MCDIDEADAVLAELAELGIDLDRITADLVEHGVRQFADAADALLGAVEAKRQAALGGRLAVGAFRLGDVLDRRVTERLEDWRRDGTIRRVWQRQRSLWPGGGDEPLGWLDALDVAAGRLSEFAAFGAEIAAEGFADVVLLGMSGSTLAGSALAAFFGARPGFPRPHLLDTTDPDAIRALEAEIDLERTLFVVGSKSGTTLETDLLLRHVVDRLHALDVRTGRHLVAITDAGSPLEDLARREGFRRVFHAEPGIDGRFGALSSFALVPAALTGHDLQPFVRATRLMVQACGADVPPSVNPGVRLGVALAEACAGGRDKLTLVLDPELAALGPWLEQLVAGATGKAGRAILPVVGELLGPPAAYGDDRLFVRIAVGDRLEQPGEAALDRLEEAGQPVIRIALAERTQIGQELFRWEMAAAVAAALLGVDPFDQPDFVAADTAVADLLEGSAVMTPSSPSVAGMGVFAAPDTARADADLPALLRAHLATVPVGGYIGVLAYLPPTLEIRAGLDRLRLRLRDRLKVATLVGLGPRYLHGTGPAFKGGPDTGVFLVLTARPETDIPVPGRSFGFGAVERAQALADAAVMRALGRPVLGLHFDDGAASGLQTLIDMVESALG
jgi:transaldolase/glucose-6-phosphate isomerase